MPDLLIRDVDDRLLDELRRLAAAEGVALEGMLRDRLTARALKDFETNSDE